MTYRWSVEGAAFEFPSPYRVENRILVLRAWGLLALAGAVMLVLAFVGEGDAARPVVQVDKLPEPGSVWPHFLGALLMALLGVLNLVQASRQRSLLLPPGLPMSLMPEVSHEATGASTGAPWLMQALDKGVPRIPELSGPYLFGLRLLGPDLAAGPTVLQAFVRVRIARLALQAGLLLLLALAAGGALGLSQPLVLHWVSLLLFGIGAAAMARHLFFPAQAAPGPGAIAALLGAGLLAALPLAWFAGVLPGASHWPRLGLPAAAAAMLVLGMAFEVLGMLAARAQLVAPQGSRVEGVSASFSFAADPARLMAEVDRELHRGWSEGVPNRRYARQPLVADAAAAEGSLKATVLEESQPTVGVVGRGGGASPPPSIPPRQPWLMALEVLGLGATLAGGLLWVWLARAHMLDSGASWAPATLGLVGLLVGGYALRIGHMPWSRVEVDSRFIWLDFAGRYYRLPGTAAVEPSVRGTPDLPVGLDGLTLRARTAKARSVFYAAAPYGFGSRALLSLSDDPAPARQWTALLEDFARHAARTAPAEAAAVAAAAARVAAVRNARPAAPAEPPVAQRRPARFCSACGTHLLAGARFCQQCGQVVAAD